MPTASSTHLLLIPSYNTGIIVLETVKEALSYWQPVCVVVDGSTDGTGQLLKELEETEPQLTVLFHEVNQGKGSAVLTGLQQAAVQGFTHILTMDADHQHPADYISEFMQTSVANPEAMILGVPVFDEHAPSIRVKGRRISNFWANLETLWAGIDDSLFGFRVYPVQALTQVMHSTRFARRFDFDPEVAVRMIWLGVPAINLAAPVRYLSAEQGGVSQFKYVRDNVLLTWMHLRLLTGFFIRLPKLLLNRVWGARQLKKTHS